MNRTAINLLQEQGYINTNSAQRAERIAAIYGYAPVKAALSFGLLARQQYAIFLKENGLSLLDLDRVLLEEQYIAQCDLIHLNAYLYAPLCKNERGQLVVAAADPFDANLKEYLERKFDCGIVFQAAADLDIIRFIHISADEKYIRQSVLGLHEQSADISAVTTFTNRQLLIIFSWLCLLVIGLVLFSIITVQVINVMANVFLFIAVTFKLWLTLKGSRYELEEAVKKSEVRELQEEDLPPYTILLPVYKEAKLIRKLVLNLQNLDYPVEKLDIKLLLEQDDTETFNAVKELDIPAFFEVIVVPHHLPKTKPKACNYGLLFSKGKYLTIYDAEDVPDADQLKKVVCLFNKLPEDYVVVQSALNYYNKNENLLTRMFTLEYSYWFDYMLTGLESEHVPIPLGGTSNHFKTDILRNLGAWDPFNVTEDADLGIRVFAKKYKAGIVNSTTLEEANKEPFNWIRQRSRWIKGYMQTYLVHMRNPISLLKKLGLRGFLGFNFFVGGACFTFLAYPVLLLIFLTYLLAESNFMKDLFPDWILFICVFNLIAGNVIMVYVNMISVFKRKYYELIIFSILNPLYWLMHSTGAYIGLLQLIYKPFYWEKTNHGLTKASAPLPQHL